MTHFRTFNIFRNINFCTKCIISSSLKSYKSIKNRSVAMFALYSFQLWWNRT